MYKLAFKMRAKPIVTDVAENEEDKADALYSRKLLVEHLGYKTINADDKLLVIEGDTIVGEYFWSITGEAEK